MKLKTPKFASKGHHDPALSAPQPPTAAPRPPAPTAAAPKPAPAPASPLRKVAGGLAAPTRQRNAAVMIAGAVLIIVAGAMGASVARSFDDSLDVLVASRAIVEGQPMTPDDFRVVQIAAAAGDIEAVSPDSIDDLVGRVAAGPIGAGSMIHPAQFSGAAEEVRVVVGAALGPDQYPAGGLKPGDQVRLIETATQFGSFSDDDEGFDSGQEIAVGEVIEVVALQGFDRHFSVRVGESVSSLVAQRVAQDRLTLALVDQSLTLGQVDPAAPAESFQPIELNLDEEPAE